MDAYFVAERLSSRHSNEGKKHYVRALAMQLSASCSRVLRTQPLAVDPQYGDTNFILDSGHPDAVLIGAHYDGFVLDNATGHTTPGANDNGSGVGVLVRSIELLAGLPVDFVFFGAEEIGCIGAKAYVANNRKHHRAMVNLDTCGSGGDLGILIPRQILVSLPPDLHTEQLVGIDAKLNEPYLAVAKARGYKVCEDDPLSRGDHCIFLREGVPATTLQGEDHAFFGIGAGNAGKGAMHTEHDTIDRVDPRFLEQIVDLLVTGTRRLVQESGHRY